MRFKSFTYTFLVLCILLLSLSCNDVKKESVEIPSVNLDHLMHLYDVVDLPGNLCGGVVRIYSEYPDY